MMAGTVRPSITRSLPSPTGAFAPWIFRDAGLRGVLIVLLAAANPSLAQEITVARLGHFTENRGWNEAGLSPSYQVVVTATVVPSAHPTVVFAEQNGVRKALAHFPYPSAPDLDLPPTATAFVIPPAVLAAGERYVLEVMLEDLEGGELQNRSLTYSEPYTVPR
jgi:hypothetical protein